MKIKPKLIALVMCFAMQPNGQVYADNHDDSELLWLPAILAGAVKGGFADPKKTICKESIASLNCGDGKGGYTDNYYVVFIDENLTPAKGPTGARIRVDSDFTFLEAEHCSADSIEFTRLNYGDLPSSLQNSWAVPDLGEQAIYTRIRVYNGTGKFDIRLIQGCIE